MKQLAIISTLLLLLTGCGESVTRESLIGLSVTAMKEFSERSYGSSKQNLESSILNLCHSKGLEPRKVQNELGEKIFAYDSHLPDGTNYSIFGYDRSKGIGIVISITNSKDKTIPDAMCERIRSEAIERGMFLSYMTGSGEIRGGHVTVKQFDGGVMIIICEGSNV